VTDQRDGDRNVLFVLGSPRAGGNSEILARRAAAALPERARTTWLALRDLSLPAFTDLRHVGDGTTPPPEGDEKVLFDATTSATDVVIVTPLYWYNVSASVKLYLDHWSGWMRVAGAGFTESMAGKTLWAVTAYAGEAAKAGPLTDVLRQCAGFLGMRWGGALLGNGTAPGDVVRDTGAVTSAGSFLLTS